MKKKILLIFVSFLILLGFSFSVSAETEKSYVFSAHDFKRPHVYELIDGSEVEGAVIYGNYYSVTETPVPCGPSGMPCVMATFKNSNNPIYRLSCSIDGVYAPLHTFVYMNVVGRIYITTYADSVPTLSIRYHSYDSSGARRVHQYPVSSSSWSRISEGQFYCDVNFTVTDPYYLQFYALYLYDTDSHTILYGFDDLNISFGIDPNGAQVEANSMISEQNSMVSNIASVITGSVNTAPLTSGVDNIVGNVTSMMPDTTDIPYVSDALGSLTQLTNIAAAEIGAFFDPFFTADMTVNIAGVSFNPFLTFLIIGVVITLITFAIKIFTRGDNER